MCPQMMVDSVHTPKVHNSYNAKLDNSAINNVGLSAFEIMEIFPEKIFSKSSTY